MDEKTKTSLRADAAWRATLEVERAMNDAVEDLANWTAGQEPNPPIEALRHVWQELLRIAAEVRAVERDTTDRARAAGGSWTPSPVSSQRGW